MKLTARPEKIEAPSFPYRRLLPQWLGDLSLSALPKIKVTDQSKFKKPNREWDKGWERSDLKLNLWRRSYLKAFTRMHKIRLLSSMFLFMLFLPSAYADELEDLELFFSHDEIFGSTAAITELNARDTPATMIVVDEDDIKKRGYRILMDVLKDIPQISITPYGSTQTRETISVRGFHGENKMIILQDGFKINSPTNERIPFSDNFPLHNVKQVEVILSPASAIYGADAFSGVINMITRDADKLDGGQVKLTGGSHESRGISFMVGQAFDNIKFVVDGSWYQSDNYNLTPHLPPFEGLKTFDGTTVLTAENRPPYRADTKAHTVHVKLDFFEEHRLIFNRSFFVQPSDHGVAPSVGAFHHDADNYLAINTIGSKHHFRFSEDLYGNLRLGHSWSEVDPKTKFINIFTGFEDIGYKYEYNRKTEVEAQLTRESLFGQWIGGFVFQDFYSIPRTGDLPSPYISGKSPRNQGFLYPNTDLPIEILEVNYTNFGGFIQFRREWISGFTSTLGIRYDQNSRFGESINPRVGLIYHCTSKTTVKLLYGRAFLAPSPEREFLNFGSFSGARDNQGRYTSGFFFVPNPGLKPEKIESFEFVLAHRFTDKLSMEVIPFYNVTDDIIGNNGDAGVSDFVPGGNIAFTLQNENIGQGKSYGVDLSTRYTVTFSDFEVDAWAGYSYIEGSISRSGDNFSIPLTFTPRHRVKAGSSLSWRERVTVTPMVLWQTSSIPGSASATPAFTNQIVPTSEFAVMNLNTTVRFYRFATSKGFRDITGSLQVDNFFDKRYDLPSGDSPTKPNPQDGRRWWFTLGIDF